MLTRLSIVFFAIGWGCWTYGCKKPLDLPEDSLAERTVIVYIAANNNLRKAAETSMEQLEEGFQGVTAGCLMVYLQKSGHEAHLIRLCNGPDDRLQRDTIKAYVEGNSSDPLFFRRVVGDAQAAAPAQTYGLVLWSHATSWAPPTGFQVKSFGADRGVEMDVKDLRDALPNNLSYILFDACSMASLEVMYELKDKARYILASPTEVLSLSFPYHLVLPHLFGGAEELARAAAGFITYYRSLTGAYRSATVALIDTREMPELANMTHALLAKTWPLPYDSREHVQRLDFDPSTPVKAYDFADFLIQNFEVDQYTPLLEQLDRTVLFKDHTSIFLGEPIRTFCGMSVYLPEENDPFDLYYNSLDWSREGGFSRLFSFR